MTYTPEAIRQVLSERHLPNDTLAELSLVHSSEMSRFLRNPNLVSAAKQARIQEAFGKILFLLSAIDGIKQETGLPLTCDWRDIRSLEIVIARIKELQHTGELEVAVAQQ